MNKCGECVVVVCGRAFVYVTWIASVEYGVPYKFVSLLVTWREDGWVRRGVGLSLNVLFIILSPVSGVSGGCALPSIRTISRNVCDVVNVALFLLHFAFDGFTACVIPKTEAKDYCIGGQKGGQNGNRQREKEEEYRKTRI